MECKRRRLETLEAVIRGTVVMGLALELATLLAVNSLMQLAMFASVWLYKCAWEICVVTVLCTRGVLSSEVESSGRFCDTIKTQLTNLGFSQN